MRTTDVSGLRELAETARRIEALTDELRRRSQALDGSAHGDELAILTGALARVTQKLVRRCAELDAEVTAPSAAPAVAGPEHPGEPAPQAHADEPPARPRSGLAIVATELAVGGASRGEVERYLRDRYGVADSTAILDEVFGAEA